LINFVNINSHNWYFKNGKFLALKNIAKKLANVLENGDFWQYLQNLAPSGNTALGLFTWSC